MGLIKVLHIVSTGRLSGAEKVVSDICTNLSTDFKPVIVCSGEELKRFYEEKGLECHIIDINGANLSERKKLSELIKEKNIDLVHGHDVKASIAGYLAAKKYRVPAISHIHVTYLWMKNFGPLKFIDKYFRNKYSISIPCSKMVEEFYLENNNSADRNKLVTLENAFNFNEFNKVKIAESNEFKEKLGINVNKYIYGYLGRLLEVKGADLMIDSFFEVQQKNENAVLLIVGDGPEREKLEAQTKKLGIQEKVIFAGYQKNVYDYMNIFDCFILPSIREGLPIAVLEAMAMKKPVLSTPVAGLKQLMKNGFNGIVLEERSKEALYDAMEKIYIDRNLSQKIAENAYTHLQENYDINVYVKKLESIYKNLLSK